ncbi:MAG: hypothetical protein AB7T01_13110 [Acidithiobacillus sp.]
MAAAVGRFCSEWSFGQGVLRVEVQLLSGRRLKFSAPLDSAWLQALVQVLEGPCG